MSNCRACGAPIMWAVSDYSGRHMPMDPVPTPDGPYFLERRRESFDSFQLYAIFANPMVDPPGPRYTRHAATCAKRAS